MSYTSVTKNDRKLLKFRNMKKASLVILNGKKKTLYIFNFPSFFRFFQSVDNYRSRAAHQINNFKILNNKFGNFDTYLLVCYKELRFCSPVILGRIFVEL